MNTAVLNLFMGQKHIPISNILVVKLLSGVSDFIHIVLWKFKYCLLTK